MQEAPEVSAGRESIKRRVVWAVLFFLSVAGLAFMTISGIKQRDYVSCNAQQVEILIQYQREASIAAREEREANDVIRRAQDEGDEVAEAKAIDHYFEVRKESDERRASHPLPELPTIVCGKGPNGAFSALR